MSSTCQEIIIILNKEGETVERLCGRQLIEGGDRCIFHDPNAWRTHAELIREEIKKQIKNEDLNFQKYHLPEIDFSKIVKEFKGPVDFREAHFHGDVNFTRIIFSRDADFRVTMFIGDAGFGGATFSRDAWFGWASFLGYAWFGGTTFSRGAWFGGTTFSRGAWFGGTTFSGGAGFEEAMFTEDTEFMLAQFLGNAGFSGVTFSGDVGFSGAKFSGNAEFEGTTFSGDARFGWVIFSGNAQFDRAKFLGESQFDHSSFLRRSYALFRLTRFHEIVSIDGVDMSGVHFSFRNTLFERGISVDEDKWSKSGYRLLTENSDLYSAIDSYQSLIVGFRNMGHYEVASELFYRRMICRKNILTRKTFILSPPARIKIPEKLRKLIKPFYRIGFLRHLFVHSRLLFSSICIPFRVRVRWRNLFEWIWMRLFYLSCGFGERPINVIIGSILTILLFMDFYLPFVKPYGGWNELFTAFLLSIDAFTPGKFLDIQFVSPGDLFVQVENILGWFMLSLFILVFTRKMIRS